MTAKRGRLMPLGILVALVAVFTGVAGIPLVSRERQLEERAKELRVGLGIDRAGTINISEMALRVARLDEIVRQSPKDVPEDPQGAALLSDLWAQIEALELQEAQIATATAVRDSRYQIHPVKISFRATFPGSFSFLRHVEGMRRLVRLNKVTLDLERGPSTTVRAPKVHIELDAFSAAREAAR